MTDPQTQRELILASLAQMLAWPEISRSPQLARFLEYIVVKTLDGDEQSIKAYSIAVDVLGRSPDFDPQSDPIVRVQARRLRSLVEDYYRGPGSADPVRIGLPVGRYVPEFRMPEPAAAPAADTVPAVPATLERRARAAGGVSVSWFALLVVLLGLGVIGFALSTFMPLSTRPAGALVQVQRPSVTVVEFQNLVGGDRGAPKVAGLAIELVTDLDQFEDLDVRYGGGADIAVASLDDSATDFVLTGIVRRDGPLVQYSAILTNSLTDGVVWNHTVAVPASEAIQADVLDEVSRRLSLVLGSPRGPLHAPARKMLGQSPQLAEAGNLYLCQLLFSIYRESGTVAAASQADICLGALPQADRDSAIGLAMAASMGVERDLGTAARDTAYAERIRRAQEQLDRAISLSPVSGFVWEQHARLHQAMGRFAMARTDYGSAIQLNPANADALAGYARLLAFGGELAEAEPMARDAVEDSPDPPSWYFGVPTLLALRAGNSAQAVENSVRYAQADRELGPILAILAGQRSGDGDVVNRYLAQVLDIASFRASGVLPRLQQTVQDKALLADIQASLGAAGVPQKALNGPF